jgi:very-short-patch-repair endonuclease
VLSLHPIVKDQAMTQFFNRTSERAKRRKKRRNMARAEVLLRSQLRNKLLLGLRFRRQYTIGPFLLDFYCPSIRLGVELDGESHFEPGAAEYDAGRQAFIERFDVQLIRFLNADVIENLAGVLEVIRRAASARMETAWGSDAATPPTPPSKGGEQDTGYPLVPN